MSAKGKVPSRIAPPVPVPRNTRSASDVGGPQAGAKLAPRPSSTTAETNCVKMNEEIVKYRQKLREPQNAILPGKSDDSAQNSVGLGSLESLKRELQDVTEKNTQWQIYNDQREEYVKNLLEQYNELHHRFHALHQSHTHLTTNPGKLSDEQRRYFDGLLIQARQELGKSREENSNLKTEIENLTSKFTEDFKKLQEDVDHWRAMYEQENEVNSRLRDERDKYARRKDAKNANKENWDRVTSLQREMESYRQDFQSERRKREKLEHRLDHLQRKVKDSESSWKISTHNTNQIHPVESSPHSSCTKSPISPPKIQKISVKPEKLFQTRRDRRSHPVEPTHITTRSRKERTYKRQEERHNALSPPNDRMNRTYSEFGHSEDSTLRCPNCGKAYGVEEHEFLLIHIDSCI